jgi:hypothetical protein
LRIGHVHGLATGQPSLHFGLEDDPLGAGMLRHSDNFEFHAACFQAQPEINIRIGAPRGAVCLHLRRRICAVQRFQSGSIACDNRSLPLI